MTSAFGQKREPLAQNQLIKKLEAEGKTDTDEYREVIEERREYERMDYDLYLDAKLG